MVCLPLAHHRVQLVAEWAALQPSLHHVLWRGLCLLSGVSGSHSHGGPVGASSGLRKKSISLC